LRQFSIVFSWKITFLHEKNVRNFWQISFAIVGVDTIRASADSLILSADRLIVFSNAIRIFTLGFIGGMFFLWGWY